MTFIQYLSHWVRIIEIIFSSRYSYGRIAVLSAYIRLFARSVAHHKLPGFRSKKQVLQERLLGFDVQFKSYGQLIALFEEIFIQQIYLFKSVTDTPSIIDCGSNIGLSILFFKKLYPSATISAFEPDPECLALLKENMERNNITNVSIHNIALSDAEQETVLYKVASVGGGVMLSPFASSEKSSQIKVIAKRLSAYISGKVDIIKIDTEGAELYILDDLLQTNKISFAKNLIIEYHPDVTGAPIDQFIAQLKDAGYSCKISHNDLHHEATDKMIYCTQQ